MEITLVDSIHLALLEQLLKSSQKSDRHSIESQSEDESIEEGVDDKSKGDILSLTESKTNHHEIEHNEEILPLDTLPLNVFTWPEILRLVFHLQLSF